MAGRRLEYQFAKDSLLSLLTRYFEYADVFKEIIIREELCGTIHRPLKGDGKLHVSAPYRTVLRCISLCSARVLTKRT